MKKLLVTGGVVLALVAVNSAAATKPDLDLAADVATLKVSFSDPSMWNGEDIPKKMQCPRNGGVSPGSPALVVGNVPPGTKSLVVYFENDDASHNHGLVRVAGPADANGAWLVPSVAHGAKGGLPQGVSIFQGGTHTPKSRGAAFWAPCPRRGYWRFKITVYAVDGKNVVTALKEMDWGAAP